MPLRTVIQLLAISLTISVYSAYRTFCLFKFPADKNNSQVQISPWEYGHFLPEEHQQVIAFGYVWEVGFHSRFVGFSPFLLIIKIFLVRRLWRLKLGLWCCRTSGDLGGFEVYSLQLDMEPSKGVLASLWNFICFLPFFIGLLLLGIIKG